jgi:hypothetical protein
MDLERRTSAVRFVLAVGRQLEERLVLRPCYKIVVVGCTWIALQNVRRGSKEFLVYIVPGSLA